MELGRLVAPMTTTEARFFIPSMRVSIWETMRRSTWVGGWVGGWFGWVEEEQAVGMRCWTLWANG